MKFGTVLIENSYRIKKEVLEKSKTAATPKQKHVGPRQFPNNAYLGDTAEEAAITAAYKVAEAENKSFVAAEAAKEAERVSKMEEDSDNSLQIYKDLFDKCWAQLQHIYHFLKLNELCWSGIDVCILTTIACVTHFNAVYLSSELWLDC
ncbi:hypothetical protein H5410_037175 [Solanum commersonii]|uniref:Uncharacterized protein n=1 Tax=Solanum commersonii TaxID=4109 RepID=A0A9J5Y7Q8_SOLCO|nr:hypothetical protein H5410_037175 [Solanum commersonii]